MVVLCSFERLLGRSSTTNAKKSAPLPSIPPPATYFNHHAQAPQARQLHSKVSSVLQLPRQIPQQRQLASQPTPSIPTTTPRYHAHASYIPTDAAYSHVPRPGIKSALVTFQPTSPTPTNPAHLS